MVTRIYNIGVGDFKDLTFEEASIIEKIIEGKGIQCPSCGGDRTKEELLKREACLFCMTDGANCCF